MPYISICHPMTGTTVEVNFTVCGRYDLSKLEKKDMPEAEQQKWYKNATIKVTVTDGSSTQMVNGTADGKGNWTAATHIGTGNDYIVTAVLNQGTVGEAADTCDDIDVVMAGMLPITVDGNPCPPRPAGDIDLTGEIMSRIGPLPKPPPVFCNVHKVRRVALNPKKPNHKHTGQGNSARRKPAKVMMVGKNWKWSVAKLKVQKEEFVVVELMDSAGEEVLATGASEVMA